ncbi:hypothetical protein [Pseudomonas phage vB_PaeM_PAO1_Ab17]|uniref:Uncharacterized protein n=2 Tax=Nankokuvirus Ab03 TaxID=1925780 RepID=A0A0A1IVQ6_9CAUD|nr:hypothetical protein VC54_gp082 [Pseudomonas phage vB_PaeM_PAO1_Ab03]CEF89234.1 hypothetical protein [Pseudomonas phage vB_PaeM_PAO1_Ab03]CEF89610.1 hypothetical protein [Pseudomonas phage vB_PaeM_PAO1_Ab17]
MNKTIRKQLNDHYDRQGLTGNHRRLAMKADLRLVEKYTDPDMAAWLKAYPVGLDGAFVWSNTPEGHNSWLDKKVPNR